MSGFVRGLASAVALIAVLGAVVTAGVEAIPTAGSTVLAQVEDEDAGEEAGAADESVVAVTSAVELLNRLRPVYAEGELPSAQRVVLSRDPFEPVIPEATGGGGTADPSDPSDPTDPADPIDPTDPTDPSDPTDPEACTGDENETVCEGLVVTLDDFTDEGLAIVTVDGVQYVVGEGEIFATSFLVLSLDDPCATLLFGDEAFSICAGATVLK